MKKHSYLLILFLISLISFSRAQNVQWDPANGGIYGDKIRISRINQDSIETRFIGYNLGDILTDPYPEYYLNGFDGVDATSFLFDFSGSLIYIAKLSYPELYAIKDTNSITISFSTSDEIIHNETAEYYYSKPVLECLEVNGEPYNENMLIVNPETCSLKIIVRSSLYPAPLNSGDDRIAGIYKKLTGTEYLDIPDTRYNDTTLNFSLSSLPFGLNELELYAFGVKADNSFPDEFSEKIKIRILKFDFFINGVTDFSVCKCDSLYFLSGDPGVEGGIFSGECVLESSNVFNPVLSGNQSTTITYSYPIDGVYYPLTRTINFDPLPQINLDVQTLAGFPNEVCGFEHGAVYELKGSGYATTDWSLPDDIIRQSYFEGDSKAIIDWDETGDGTIYVTATSDKGCKTRLEHMIHIGYNKAPIDSAYVIVMDKMLFCDADTNEIKIFYWYGIINGEIINYDSTSKPYYFIGFKPNSGDSFYAWTAKDETSCMTQSHIFTVPKSLDDNNGYDPSEVRIFPNPSDGNVNCEFLMPLSNGLLTITNLLGQEIDRVEYNNIDAGDVVRLETGDYQRGIYFLNFSNDSILRSYKIIIY